MSATNFILDTNAQKKFYESPITFGGFFKTPHPHVSATSDVSKPVVITGGNR